MDATFQYDAEDIKAILIANHEAKWVTPPGCKWVAQAEAYGILAVKVELVEEKAKEEEEA